MSIVNFLASVVGAIGLVVAGVVIRILSEDAKTYIPRLCAGLIKSASTLLPENDRSRYLEEWLAHSGECPELSAKLSHAIGLRMYGASRTAREIGAKQIPGLALGRMNRLFDLTFLALIIPVALPIILLLAMPFFASGRAPFVRVKYVGFGGKEFHAFYINIAYPTKNGASIYHRFLARSSLFELPVLANVALGDMSLVGPRPLRPSANVRYPGKHYEKMRPGVVSPGDMWCEGYKNLEVRAKHEDRYFERGSFVDYFCALVRPTLELFEQA